MRLLLLLLFSLSAEALVGQNMTVIDSLVGLSKTLKDDSAKAEVLLDLNYQWAEFNFDSSYHYAVQGLLLAQKINNPYLQRKGINAIGIAYDYDYQLDSALHYYLTARDFAQKIGDWDGYASGLFNVGVIHSFKGEMESTIDYYQQADSIYEQLGNDRMRAIVSNNLGIIYRKTRKYDMAIISYNEALRLKKKQGNEASILNTLTNLSTVYRLTEQFDSALHYSNQVLDLSKKLRNQSAYQLELINMGDVYGEWDNSELAIKYYQEAQEMLSDQTPYQTRASLQTRMAHHFIERSQWEKALHYLEDLMPYLVTDSQLELLYDYYLLQYQANKGLGRSTKALGFLEEAVAVKEQLTDNQILDKTSELQELYEKEKRENEISQLNARNEINSLVIEKQQQRQLGLLLVVVLMVILLGLTYKYYSNNKKALAEREVLLREIHHRVKNNLQIVTSLLQLQSENLTDQAAVDAVREGENRVRSMALIHQRLYSTDDVRGVSMESYLDTLFSELFAAFGVDQSRITYRLDTQEIKLDIDTVIPLGLILNELITNCLKYAFEGKESGVIHLSMEEKQSQLMVILQDDGRGLTEAELQKSNSFGWSIIRSLGRKLKAKISVATNQGTTVTLSINRYNLVR